MSEYNDSPGLTEPDDFVVTALRGAAAIIAARMNESLSVPSATSFSR